MCNQLLLFEVNLYKLIFKHSIEDRNVLDDIYYFLLLLGIKLKIKLNTDAYGRG